MRPTSRTLLALTSAGASLGLATATVALATAPNGETPTPLARGALNAPANVSVKVTGGSVRIKTQGLLDALVLEVTLAPGGTGGWHSHAGPLISIVKHGTLTMLDGNCTPHDIAAGHAMISPGGSTEKDENNGTTPVVFDVTFLIPHGATSPRIDEPAPAGCTT